MAVNLSPATTARRLAFPPPAPMRSQPGDAPFPSRLRSRAAPDFISRREARRPDQHRKGGGSWINMSEVWHILHRPGCRSDKDGVGCTCRPQITKDAAEALAWERRGRLPQQSSSDEPETTLRRVLRTGIH